MMPVLEKYYKEPLYRNSIAIMLNTASGAIFGFLFWIVVAHLMSSSNLGLAVTLISVITLISTLSILGMDDGLIRFLPRSDNKNDLYSTMLIITLAVSIGMTVIFIIFVNYFSPSLSFIKTGLFPLILIIYAILNTANAMQNITLIALRRGDLSFFQSLILGIRILILFFIAFLGVKGIISAFEIALFLTVIFGFYVIHKLGINFRFKINLESLKGSIGFSLGNYTATIFSVAPTTILPIMIINTTGAKNAAYFSIANSIASTLYMISSSMATSLFVEGSHNLPIKENVIKSFKFIFLLLVPSVLFILIFGDRILFIFSKEYATQAFQILQLLSIATLFSTVMQIYLSIKRIQKDIKIINILNLTASLLIIMTGYFFLSEFGLVGMGYAWIITNAIMCVIVIYMVYYREKWFK